THVYRGRRWVLNCRHQAARGFSNLKGHSMRLVMTVAAVMFAFIGGAQAGDAGPSQPSDGSATAPAAETAQQKLVCKRIEEPGSHLGTARKVCKTAEEWDKITRNGQDSIRDLGHKPDPTGPH